MQCILLAIPYFHIVRGEPGARARLRILSLVLVAVSLLFAAKPSQAQLDLGNIGPSKGQVIGAAVGAIAAVTVIGLVVYCAVREPRVTGCVTAGPDGGLAPQGTGTGDPIYMLQNAPPTLKACQREKVLGHKKKNADKSRVLNVDRVAKVHGPCSPPAHAMLIVPPAMAEAVAP